MAGTAERNLQEENPHSNHKISPLHDTDLGEQNLLFSCIYDKQWV